MLSLPKHLYRFVAISKKLLTVEMLRQAQHDVLLINLLINKR